MQDWIVPAAAGVLALVALGLGIALLRARARTDHELAASRADSLTGSVCRDARMTGPRDPDRTRPRSEQGARI